MDWSPGYFIAGDMATMEFTRLRAQWQPVVTETVAMRPYRRRYFCYFIEYY